MMNDPTPDSRPRALESPLQSLSRVEEAAFHRLRKLRGRWPGPRSRRVLSLIRDNHRTNADLLAQLSADDEAVDVAESPHLQALQELLVRAEALTKVVQFENSHLEQLERSLVRAYEMETAPEVGHLSTHAKKLLRSGNLIRAAQNLRVVRQVPPRRERPDEADSAAAPAGA